ncbi:TPA: leucine-rich repeat protein [bacterium]|nr:leucine-rich repeat protein [bacterium]
MKKFYLAFSFVFLSMLLLAGCVSEKETYTITWEHDDGTTLYVDENVSSNDIPVFTGTTPKREETHFYSYTFKGWTPSVGRATEDKTYTAVFEKTNKYTDSDNLDFELLGNDTYQLNRYQVTSTDESVIIPSIYNDKPISTIKINAFNGASNIKTLGIPSSIRDIKSGTFSNMVNLETIIVDESNSSFSSKGGLLFDKSQTTLLKYPEGRPQKTYLIPNHVTTVGEYAIFKVASLENIIIPESVINMEWIAINRTKDLIIYTEVNSEPEGWVVGWSDPEGPVYWKGEWHLVDYGIPTPN